LSITLLETTHGHHVRAGRRPLLVGAVVAEAAEAPRGRGLGVVRGVCRRRRRELSKVGRRGWGVGRRGRRRRLERPSALGDLLLEGRWRLQLVGGQGDLFRERWRTRGLVVHDGRDRAADRRRQRGRRRHGDGRLLLPLRDAAWAHVGAAHNLRSMGLMPRFVGRWSSGTSLGCNAANNVKSAAPRGDSVRARYAAATVAFRNR
ncbi:unnamed protein product, partial [Pelagomonas calceolata]